MLGFAELMQEDRPLPEDQQHAIQVIEKNGKRLLNADLHWPQEPTQPGKRPIDIHIL